MQTTEDNVKAAGMKIAEAKVKTAVMKTAEAKVKAAGAQTPHTLTADQIEQILPHRYPFLLVDRIVDMEPGVRAEGVKCVSANEPFFQGHFPGQKIMPGVLILEALAQTGAVAILSKEENKGKLVLFGGVNKARFRSQVTPGDVLTLRCGIEKQKGAVGIGSAEAYVNGKIAVKAELVFAIGDRNSYDRDCKSE